MSISPPENCIKFQRIMIIGLPGCGKSTFARKLAKHFVIPVHHLDRHFIKDPGKFLQVQQTLVEGENWIIDGNMATSLEIRFKRADIVLYFKFNRLLCIWRLLCHKERRVKKKIELIFTSYLWKFDKRVKETLQELQRKYPHVAFYELHNDQEKEEMKKRLTMDEWQKEGFC